MEDPLKIFGVSQSGSASIDSADATPSPIGRSSAEGVFAEGVLKVWVLIVPGEATID